MHAIILRCPAAERACRTGVPTEVQDTCRDSAVTPVECALPTRTWWVSVCL
jgi:hypothetical protein